MEVRDAMRRALKRQLLSAKASPGWPSASSIATDTHDSSRVHSEVLAASRYLPRLCSTRATPIATSSVVNFPMAGDHDRVTMPPPSMSRDSEPHCFSRWRVLLNDQGQLVVKGTLASGKVVRSKPIIQRFSANKLQSAYKHIYFLEGPIVDDRHELPEYVRGKFYNGFPDDWENVHQLWRNYIAGGSQYTFRWPTPITDDDDDLASEVTDFVYTKEKKDEKNEPAQVLEIVPQCSSSLGYHSKTTFDSNPNFEISQEDSVMPKNNSAQDKMKKSVEVQQVANENVNNDGNRKCTEDCKKICESDNASSSAFNSGPLDCNPLYEILNKDKLRIMLCILSQKDCPSHYFYKFFESLNFLNFLMSLSSNYKSEIDTDEKENSSSFKNQDTSCKRCVNSLSETQETNPEEGCNKVQIRNEQMQTGVIEKNVLSNPNSGKTEDPNDENYAGCIRNNKNDSSDSDQCMGIPDVSLNHLIKPKISGTQRYKDRRKHFDKMQSENDKAGKERIEYDEDRKFNTLASGRPNPKNECEKRNEENQNRYSHQNRDVTDDIGNNQVAMKTTDYVMQRSIGKPKVVIKNCEPVQCKFAKNLVQPRAVDSDVTIDDDQVPHKIPKLSNHLDKSKSEKFQMHESIRTRLNENFVDHPFLRYDTEDEFNDKEINVLKKKFNENELVKIEIADKQLLKNQFKKHDMVNKDGALLPKLNYPFGSRENPKILSSWVPRVIYDDESRKRCSLTFEGKLVSESGYTQGRKVSTDSIHQRHSLKLLETVTNIYYLLDGEMCDTKHIVPKELVRYCRLGCPESISDFCNEWKKFKQVSVKNTIEKSQNSTKTSMETKSIECSNHQKVSTPNSYDGMKLSDSIYKTPTNLDNVQIKSSKSTEVMKKSMESNEQPRKYYSEKVTNAMSLNHNPLQIKDDRSSHFIKKSTKKPQVLHFCSSSDSEYESLNNKRKMDKSPKKKISRASQQQAINSQRIDNEVEKQMNPNQKLRKRQKPDSKPTRNVGRYDLRLPATTNRDSSIKWIYQKGQPPVDILSEDQVSIFPK